MAIRQQCGIDDLSFCEFRGLNDQLRQQKVNGWKNEFSINCITCHANYFG